MCYGNNCGLENRTTGTCHPADRHLCPDMREPEGEERGHMPAEEKASVVAIAMDILNMRRAA